MSLRKGGIPPDCAGKTFRVFIYTLQIGGHFLGVRIGPPRRKLVSGLG